MKKGMFIMVLIVVAFAIWAPTYGGKDKHPRNMDGTDWTRFSQAEKMGFILGFSAIHDIVMRRARETNDFIDYVLPNLCPEEFESQREKLLLLQLRCRFPVDEFELDEVTPPQISKGLEEFYKDQHNLVIKIVNAIYIAREKIRGKDLGYIEAWTRWLRKPKRERIRLSRRWRIEGARGLSPNAYRAEDGTVYLLFDYVPFD
jgi:hypothetical protein